MRTLITFAHSSTSRILRPPVFAQLVNDLIMDIGMSAVLPEFGMVAILPWRLSSSLTGRPAGVFDILALSLFGSPPSPLRMQRVRTPMIAVSSVMPA